MQSKLDRRRFLATSMGMALTAPNLVFSAEQEKWDPDEGVTAPEDLMKEHGVLNRCLLIYEEGMRRMHRNEEKSLAQVEAIERQLRIYELSQFTPKV